MRRWSTAERLSCNPCPTHGETSKIEAVQVFVYPNPLAGCPKKPPPSATPNIAQRGLAVANGSYLAAVNRTATQSDTEFWGRWFVANPYGEIVAKASTEIGEMLYHDLDLQAVEDFRRIWPFYRDRHIDAYGERVKLAGAEKGRLESTISDSGGLAVVAVQ